MSKGLEALKDIYNSLINDIEQEEDEFYNPSDDIKYWKEKYNVVKQDLERLEQLEKENNNLKKALDKACERLEWSCPVGQDLIDDLDCENCKNTEKECWKKYFLNEVLKNG